MSFDEFDALLRRSSPGRGERHSVVVIDDDPSIREGMAILLGDNYQLRLCGSAEEGINAMDEDTCAVILDVKMPGRDGFWACSEIRKKSPFIPVIFYSAYQDVKNPYEIVNEHRPFGYVVKDQDATRLVDMLAVAVKLHSVVVSNHKLVAGMSKHDSG